MKSPEEQAAEDNDNTELEAYMTWVYDYAKAHGCSEKEAVELKNQCNSHICRHEIPDYWFDHYLARKYGQKPCDKGWPYGDTEEDPDREFIIWGLHRATHWSSIKWHPFGEIPKTVGCYNCLRIYNADLVDEWIYQNSPHAFGNGVIKIAICKFCRKSTLVPDKYRCVVLTPRILQ